MLTKIDIRRVTAARNRATASLTHAFKIIGLDHIKAHEVAARYSDAAVREVAIAVEGLAKK
ncbi:MAG: hypothetical protein J0G33_08155 [Afipia felis]|nr:hypothetical protein [Afipia felis]